MTRLLKPSFALLVTLILLFNTACGPSPSIASPTPEIVLATPRPTATHTPEPLSSAGNPLVMGFAGTNTQEARQAADEIARLIAEQTGYAVRSQLYATYPALLEEMQNGRIHFAWLPPATYAYANQRGFADVRLVTSHFGVYKYGVQFLANANSGYQIYYDPVQDKNVAEAPVALAQFNGKTPCLVEPGSLTGYLIPLGYLTEINITWNEPLFLRSSTGIVRALYITGICDFGATFAISGDPRTSSAVQGDLTDAMQRVPIIWRSEPIIPNLGLAFLPEIPSNMQASIEFSLQDLVKSEEGRRLLSTANNYEIQDLLSIDDQYYQRFRELLANTNTNLRDLIGK